VLEFGKRWITFDGRLVETHAGLAAAAGRRWDEAESHFAVARTVAEEMSNRLELADLQRLHARLLLDRDGTGDHTRAVEMLRGALASYQACGISAYVAETERLGREVLA
jgi:hypothetical protein